MFALSGPDRSALYFTVVGEPPLKMLRYQQQFTFFDMRRVNESVRYVNLSQEVVNGSLETLLERIVQEVEATSPGVVIVDSFRTVAQAAARAQNGTLDLQHFVQQLAVRLTGWEATTFLVGEYQPSESDQNPVFTVADGLVWLDQSVDRNSMVRKMQIMKMRGQAPIPGLHTFRITGDGIQVFPGSSLHRRKSSDRRARNAHTEPGTGSRSASRDSTKCSAEVFQPATQCCWQGRRAPARACLRPSSSTRARVMKNLASSRYSKSAPESTRRTVLMDNGSGGSFANTKWASFIRGRWISQSTKCSMKSSKAVPYVRCVPSGRYRLIRQIRQFEAEHGGFLPAVALTGYARAEIGIESSPQVSRCIPKPVEPVELTAAIAAITHHLRGGTANPTSSSPNLL